MRNLEKKIRVNKIASMFYANNPAKILISPIRIIFIFGISIMVFIYSSVGYSSEEISTNDNLNKPNLFWNHEQNTVSAPGLTLYGYLAGAIPIRNGGGVRLEGGPEFRIQRILLAIGFSSDATSRMTGFSNSKLAFPGQINTLSISGGFAIFTYSGCLVTAVYGLQTSTVLSRSVRGNRLAIEARYGSIGLEASMWNVSAPILETGNEWGYHDSKRNDYVLTIKYRLRIGKIAVGYIY